MTDTNIQPISNQEFDMGWIIKHSIIGGVIVAVVFAVAEMILNALFGSGGLLMPFKAFASVPLGIPPPEIPLSTALPVGLIFHLIYTVILVFIFIVIWANVSALRSSPIVTVVAASVYGIITWAVGVNVLAPAFGRPWFAAAPQVLPFIYHAVFFGMMLGLYLVWAARQPRTA